MDLCYRTLQTSFGHVGFVAGGRGLKRVYLPEKSAAALRRTIQRDYPAADESPALLPGFTRQLQQYFDGDQVTFDVPLDCADANAFEARVWRACRKVQYGRTATYKDLAARVGKPNAARAVGNAMGRNRFPIVVPCHRILRSDGALGGYSGPLGLPFKQRLLTLESAAH